MPESIRTRDANSAPAPARRPSALVRWWAGGGPRGTSWATIRSRSPGTDTYEWLPGGFFLVHHVDVMVGQQPVQALELIGEYDPATGAFLARAYDNLGNVTLMRAKVDEQGVWTFTRMP